MYSTWKSVIYLVSILTFYSTQPVFGQVEFEQHIVDDNYGQGVSVFCTDVDGDGDMDLLGASRQRNEISWWENDGEQQFEKHVIANNFVGAEDVYAIDLDQDGDMDVIGAAVFSDQIIWWENNEDQDFVEHIICEEFRLAATVAAADLDGDGDIDILGGGELGVYWWENDGDQEFEEHILLEEVGRVYDIYTEDIDDDDDFDILIAFYDRHMVSWMENEGNGNFQERIIDDRHLGAIAVHAADLDDDGDKDVIAGAYGGFILSWYENNGEQNFEEHTLIEDLIGIWDVFASDINLDRDIDLLCSSYGIGTINWWENEGNDEFEMHNIVEDFTGATGIFAADLDQDGDVDVIGTAYGERMICWWENLSSHFRIITDIDSLDFGPVIIETERMLNLQIICQSENEQDPGDIRVDIQVSNGDGWLSVEPQEAVMELDDTLEVEVSVFIGEGEELGAYEGMIRVAPDNQPARSVEIPVSLFAVEGFGSLTGVVIDAATDEVMPGISVELEGIPLQAETDDEGIYLFENLPAWSYIAVVNDDRFLTYRSEEFDVNVNEDVELNIGLLHALCELDMDSISVEMVPDRVANLELTLSNPGNGTLRFWVESSFPLIGDVEPWDLLSTVDAAEQTGDNRLQGVVFAGNNLYVSGGNNGERRGLIHVFSREGEHLESFDQFCDSPWGMRGLTWDGELIWGADNNIIYGFTPEGDLRQQFEGPLEINRAMTWDEERGRLWVCDVSTDLFGMDRAGNLLDRIELPPDLHIYGLGTFPEDEDGCTIYTFSKDGVYFSQVSKINPDEGDLRLVINLETRDELKAGGSCITSLWNPLSWVFIGVMQGREMVDDELRLWYMNSNNVWMISEPDSGTVVPDGSAIVDVTIDSEGCSIGAELSCELVITHNGRGERITVPVVLRVVREEAIEPSSEASGLPGVCKLNVPYPNPFNSSMIINYSIPSPQLVSLSAWDINGRKVADLVHGLHKAGLHRVIWEGSELSTGTYIVHLETGESVLSRKVVHIK